MTHKEKYNGTATVDVIIPAYRPGREFGELLHRLEEQEYRPRRILIMNTGEQYWNREWEKCPILEVHHLEQKDFDHGGTRRRAAELSNADIMIFMTQDALPADRKVIGNLVCAVSENPGAGAAYARQLPRADCRFLECYTRSFNYPEKSCLKTKADLKRLGIKTFFASNVCCAYDREKFWFQGGFIKNAIFNEDMIFAGKAVMEDDYAIAYVADAKVIHSHNYNCTQQFKRNFDLAVSQADHPEVFGGIRSESEGIRLVKQTAHYLSEQHKPWLIPGMFVKSGFKYMGYRMGKAYHMLPQWLVMKCTMNREYWLEKKEGGDRR